MADEEGVQVCSGPGYWMVTDWRELWQCMWRAVAHTMEVMTAGKCSCGCDEPICDYCAYECPRG